MTANGTNGVNGIRHLTNDELERVWELSGNVPDAVQDCMHRIISARALGQPTKTAVHAWDGEFTYGELDDLSSRLARRLVELRVGAEAIVPLCFEKSKWTVVAMLGVLKAGGAFALLDINQPENRLYSIIEQCHASIICTSSSGRFSPAMDVEVVVVGPDSQHEWPLNGIIPSESSPTSAMYVCFTSGSTGEPKGIIVTHSSFCTACRHQVDVLGFHSQSRVFDFASYSFDVAIHNAMATLFVGGTLCIPSEEQRKSSLGATMREMRVTIADLTPSVTRLLDPEVLPNMEAIILSGEAVRLADVERLWGHVKVRNGYGPAECTPISAVNASPKSPEAATSIGRGKGVATWVVDPNDSDRLVLAGEVGELLLEGPTLARGYLNDKQKTAAAFIEDPPWLVRGCRGRHGRSGRLYKTGDLVHYNGDGNLMYVGRKDFQVKIRGQRVELAEVEHHVRACMESITKVVVEAVAPGGVEEKMMLAAFIINQDSSANGDGDTYREPVMEFMQVPEHVDRALSRLLPSYMVPAVYFRLSWLPLTASGKTDRRLLREMASALSVQQLAELQTAAGEKKKPRTEAERRLQKLWAEVLQVESGRIGLDDSFFRLGGDSITAMKLVSEASKVGVIVTVTGIFEHPALVDQAQVLEVGQNQETQDDGAEEIQPPLSLLNTQQPPGDVFGELATLCQVNLTSIEDAYPCTPLQEGLLSLSAKRPGDYMMQAVLELSSETQLEAFREAWERVLLATAILRTRIVHHRQLGLLQVVLRDEIEWRWPDTLDLYLENDKETAMGLGGGLSRFALVGSETCTQRYFVWTVHHALYDGWSIRLVLDAVRNAYQDVLAGHVADSTEKSGLKGFDTFIRHLANTKDEEVDEFWRTYFADGEFAPFPALPALALEPAADTELEVNVDFDLTGCATTGATLATVVHGALAIILSQYTGSSDAIFGSVLAGRKAPVAGIENVVGPTIATVPMRVRVPKEQMLLEFLDAVQRQTTSMVQYEQTGLQRIAKASDEARLGVGFQTLLVVQPEKYDPWANDPLGSWRRISEEQDSVTYSVTLECLPAPRGVRFRAGFDSRVMDSWTMERMLLQLGVALQGLVNAQQGQTIRGINNALTANDEVVWGWNGSVPSAVERCMHELVAEQVQSQPDIQAVYAWDGQLTYRELDDLASQLACHLVSLGVGPEVVVGLCFEKSMWMVVAMLSVFKAGGAFVSLDAGDAADRRLFALTKTKANVVLLSDSCKDISLAPERIPFVVSHETMARLPAGDANVLVPSRANPRSLAYVIFTSGSTGEPKGVLMEHRSIATSCLGHGSFGLSKASRILQFAPYTFDACIAEIMTTLIHGACVCVPSGRESFGNLVNAINTMEVNVALLTPTVARMIPPETIPGIELLVLAGEAVRQSDYEPWVGRCKLVNGYGPTEAAVCSIAGTYDTKTTKQDSIGTAVGCVSWVADPSDHNMLVPLGAVGELLLEGPILARGYLDTPERTAAVFINDPEWLLRGGCGCAGRRGRLYKTGDLVRQNEDGSLSYIGRKDTQVKIRGQRLELGEVEYNVHECMPYAKQVVATVIEPVGGRPMLAIYLTMEDGEGTGQEMTRISEDLELVNIGVDVETALSLRLAAHMIPSIYFRIRAVPLTTSGKTNLKRLHEMGSTFSAQQLADIRTAAEEGREKRAPQTEAELLLRDLWAEILKIKPSSIGADDSFFKLGGDSVAAMLLVGAARRVGVTLEVVDIFRQPVLASQAKVLAEQRVVGDKVEIIPPFSLLGDGSSNGSTIMDEIRDDLSVLCGLEASRIQDTYPCTPLQEGLLSLSAKRTGDYVLHGVLALSADVQPETFQAAVLEVFLSTAIFRTRIVHHGRLGLVQIVCQEGIEWGEGDELEGYLEEDKLTPMQMGDQLCRFALVKEDEQRYFVWTVHHALYDGWSLGIFMGDVWSVYRAIITVDLQQGVVGKRPGFNTFIKYLQGSSDADAEAYWKAYLGNHDFAPFPTLPSTVREPLADGTMEVTLSTTATATTTGMTMSTIIRGALGLLLSRYTGSADVIFGAVSSGRNAPIAGIEEIIGSTIATVPVRVHLQAGQPVSEYLETLQQDVTDMIAHEQFGLRRIARVSEGCRTACGFQTLLVVRSGEEELLSDNTLGKWETAPEDKSFVTYAVTLDCLISREGVKIRAAFDTRVVDTWRMEKMLQQLATIIKQLASTQPQTVDEVNALTEVDTVALWDWNASVPDAIQTHITTLFDEHVRAQPEAQAVHAWNGTLTYQELDDLSTKLACHLTHLGAGQEIVVPLCFEKSLWTVVAVMGVVKAGAAFALLDVNQPEYRLQSIIKRCRANIICTSGSPQLYSRLAALAPNIVIVGPDTQYEWAVNGMVASGKEGSIANPSSPLYVCFTSGSTGEPKGIVITHASFCTARQYQISSLGFDAQSRVFDFAGYSFDVAVHNVMTTLSTGGCLCVPSDEQRKTSLNETLGDMGATIVNLTQSVARFLEPELIPKLRHLILLGEAANQIDLERLWGRHFTITNTYGPAECTPISTINTTAASVASAVGIGRGFGVATWVVEPDNHQRLSPPGAVGELLLEGPTLARGYLNDPEKTAAAFIEDPVWLVRVAGLVTKQGRHGRLYKTGDLVRYEKDGSLSFVGRKDTQAKIRGQRLELGEVEHHVREALSATQVVAEVIMPGKNKDKAMLAAFITSDEVIEGQAGDEIATGMMLLRVRKDVNEALARRLPSYMMPSVYIIIDQIPLTGSGKIDRKWLREIGSSLSAQDLAKLRTAVDGKKQQPQTESERTLQKLWADVLKVEPDSISLDDSFFQLGGDSVAAMKLVAAARRLGSVLSVSDVFQHPTLAAQTKVYKYAPNADTEPIPAFSLLPGSEERLSRELAALVGIDAGEIEDAYPCTPLQEGLLSLSAKEDDYVMQAVFALSHDTQPDRLCTAWDKIVSSTAILRTRIVQHPQLGLVQVVCRERVEWTLAADLETHLTEDKQAPMGLGGRLSRVALVDGGADKSWIVWSVHHALYDGWSLRLLMDRIGSAYDGQEILAPALFNGFVRHVSAMNGADADMFWQSYLAGGEFSLFPAVPAASPARESSVYQTIDFNLTPTSTKTDITTSTLVRSALGYLLSQYTGSTDVVFGAVVFGRNAPVVGIDDVIGPTIATVPIRVQVPIDETVGDYLRRVQREAAAMMAYEQTGLQRIAKMGEGGRLASGFQTLLIVQPEEDDLQAGDKLGTWHTSAANQGLTTYALTLECLLRKQGGITVRASFDTTTMDSWRVERMLRQLNIIQAQLAHAQPRQTLAEIDTLAGEDEASIWGWNGSVPVAIKERIHDLIGWYAQTQPDAQAVDAWDGTLTYDELNYLSTKLSYYLASRGVGRDIVVPLCFEKSMWTPVAMLGVLKAGGAFALVDTSQPDHRLHSIIKRCRSKTVCIGNPQLSVRLAQLDLDVVVVGRDQKEMWPTTGTILSPADPASAMYTCFTSGSTGEPKGIIITHGSFCTARWHQVDALRFTPDSRVFDFASYSFDVAVHNAMMTLSTGGCLCIPSDEQRKTDLAAVLRTTKATIVNLTPSVARLLEPSDVLPDLQTLILLGEAARKADLDRLWSTFSIINTYGPAECTPISTINTTAGDTMSAVGIGAGVGIVTWVVNVYDANRLVPVGAVGELLLEGPLLARGYLHDEEKTEEQFIYDPPWLTRGPQGRQGRLYKTGDLVRYNEDGSLVYVGRKDTQVKIHGQRVELGEIEHQVRHCMPHATDVIAEVIQPAGDGKAALVSVFISTQDRGSDEAGQGTPYGAIEIARGMAMILVDAAVEMSLSRRLPTYMMPSAYFYLTDIPLTPSGKTDRKRLREMASVVSTQQLADLRRMAEGETQEPQTEAERRLRDLWAEVLGIDGIGRNDHFFRLGGDSIAAMKLVGMARKSGIALTVAQIFEQPTLAMQAKVQPQAAANEVLDSEDAPPFSLLSGRGNLEGVSEEMSALCNLDASQIEDAYPCTPLQEGLLSLNSRRAGDYVMQAVLELSPSVQLGPFQAAWEEVVQSAPILRTRFVQHGGLGLVQVVCQEGINWKQAKNLDDYLDRDKVASMELGDPLSRFAIVCDGSRSWFVWTIHHALYDGLSLRLLSDNLQRAYHRNMTNTPNNAVNGIDRKRTEFRAFVRHLAGRDDRDTAEAFWRSYLADGEFTPFPELPTRIGEPTANETIELVLASTTKAETATASTLIRGALALLISQQMGSSDVVFGTVVSGRNAPVAGIEEIIGPTVATVPIRVRVWPEQLVPDYLEMVQREATQMIAYEQTGLQCIARLGENEHAACDFQTLLVVQPEEDELQDGKNIFGIWQTSAAQRGAGTYAIALECLLRKEGGMRVMASFDARVVDRWRMENMLQLLCDLLKQLANAQPGQTIGEVNALTVEHEERIWEWNNSLPDRVQSCIHDLVIEQAKCQPEAQAVVGWDGELSYGELDSLSTRLACHLSGLGVHPGTAVPLIFEKSIWAVVAMLGVLKVGCAFVSLDASQTAEKRQHFILQETRAHIVLTSASHSNVPLPPGCIAFVVDQEALIDLPGSGQSLATLSRVGPSSTAYIIFTSGSTGTPKGVVLDHGAVSTSFHSHGTALGFDSSSRVLQFASYAFDASVQEIFATLIHGGCVCVPSDEQRSGDLAGAMHSMGVTMAILTPTVARLLPRDQVPTLYTLVLCGEPVTSRDYELWDGLPRIVNGYGPTEAAVCSVAGVYNGDTKQDAIGKAVGCATWVADPSNQDRLVPLGAIGELLLEGPILARGYLNDVEKTAATFIEDPPWLTRGGRHGRIYKTGDLVRYNEDGSLSFIGRKDTQIKIRGHRVELSEVEHQVQESVPTAKQVVVEVIKPTGKKSRAVLAAFMTGEDGITNRLTNGGGEVRSKPPAVAVELDIVEISAEIDDTLSQRLPSYMMPSVYFRLPSFPLLASGKTDRKKLREMASTLSARELARKGKKKQPGTEAERQLQRIWARVLNLEENQIGVEDSFFRLGGDSITAMQVSSAARASLGNISTADIFRKKTIARLAATLGSSSDLSDVDGNVDDAGEKEPFPLSPIQSLYMKHERDVTRCFNQSCLVKLRTRIKFTTVRKAVETLAARHPMLRARFSRTSNGGWEQRVSDDVSDSLYVHEIDRARCSGHEQMEAMRCCCEMLDIERGPLVAAVSFDGAEFQSLFISIHHLVIDLVSWRILLQELEELLTVGQVSLPPTTTTFRKWCLRQAQYVAENLDSEKSTSLNVQPPLLSYWDVEASSNTQGATSVKRFTLDGPSTEAILGRCNDVFGTRPVELMTAALIQAFNVVFRDRPTPAVFSEGHGREPWDGTVDPSRTVGWFTTLFPIQVQATPDTDMLDTVRQTKDFFRKLSKNGWSYFNAKFADEAKAKINASGFPVEIVFNYAGSYKQLERADSFFENLGTVAGSDAASAAGLRRMAIFDFMAQMDRCHLDVSVTYPEGLPRKDQIARWMEQYHVELRKMAVVLQRTQPQWTLSDFPMAFKSYDDLGEFRERQMSQLGIKAPSDIEDIYPCSSLQEGILIAQGKDATHYWTSIDIDILATDDTDDSIDLARVEQAWRAVVRRHSLLRAILVGNIPGSSRTMHIILRDPAPEVSYLQGKPEEYRPGDTNSTMRGEGPSQKLQHHLSIYRVDDKHACLRLEINHAIVDGYSRSVLLRDFGLAYTGSSIPEDGPLYSEFIRYVESQPQETREAFWREQLRGAEPCVFPPLGDDAREADGFTTEVPSIDVNAIHAFCADWEVTSAAILQVAWALVLRMYTGSSAPCFGILTSGRDAPIEDIDAMFGPLLGMIPCQVDLDTRRRVVDLLKDAQNEYIESLAHQTYPLMEIHRALSIGPTGLFNSIISFQRGRGDSVELEDGHIIRYRDGREQGEVRICPERTGFGR
jgi:amino acid adenylation domain-containing protein/non-ribosomal peptide synthase protein (TIGR01720 family)